MAAAAARRVMFMGANGFPAGVYEPVTTHLESMLAEKGTSVQVTGVDYHAYLKLGETSNWEALVDMTVEKGLELAKQNQNERITAIGHSAGGALISCAASKASNLFDNVVLVDPPMFNPYKVRAHDRA